MDAPIPLLDRVRAFLPQIAAENDKLSGGGFEAIEVFENDEREEDEEADEVEEATSEDSGTLVQQHAPQIRMELALGLFELRSAAAVAAAERAVAAATGAEPTDDSSCKEGGGEEEHPLAASPGCSRGKQSVVLRSPGELLVALRRHREEEAAAQLGTAPSRPGEPQGTAGGTGLGHAVVPGGGPELSSPGADSRALCAADGERERTDAVQLRALSAQQARDARGRRNGVLLIQEISNGEDERQGVAPERQGQESGAALSLSTGNLECIAKKVDPET